MISPLPDTEILETLCASAYLRPRAKAVGPVTAETVASVVRAGQSSGVISRAMKAPYEQGTTHCGARQAWCVARPRRGRERLRARREHP